MKTEDTILSLSVYLTDKCNLKCQHCFINASPSGKKQLTWTQIKNIINFYHQQNYQIIEFTGGEACLSPHIRKAVSYARSVGFPNIGINSNAVTPHVFSIFSPQELDKVTISLDGASAQTHDKIRGAGSFDRTMESISIGLKKGFNVEVIYTVNKYNQSEITKIIQLLDQLEVNKLSFNYVSPLGNAKNHTDILISPEEWIEARQKIEATKDLKHLSLRFPLMFATPKEYQSLVEQGYQCLLPNTTKTEIRPDSKIYHCCLTAENPNVDGGHIENDRIIFDKEKEIDFLKKNYSFACPARPCPPNQKLIPICVYYKKIIEPGSST